MAVHKSALAGIGLHADGARINGVGSAAKWQTRKSAVEIKLISLSVSKRNEDFDLKSIRKRILLCFVAIIYDETSKCDVFNVLHFNY